MLSLIGDAGGAVLRRDRGDGAIETPENLVRPISLLTLWISEGLTQAQS